MLRRAKAGGCEPSLVLASPYRRAVETAEIAADVLGYKGNIVRLKAFEPEASPHDAWEDLRQQVGAEGFDIHRLSQELADICHPAAHGLPIYEPRPAMLRS